MKNTSKDRKLTTLIVDELSYRLVTWIIARSRRTGLFQDAMFVIPADLIGQRLISTGNFELSQLDALDLIISNPRDIIGINPNWSGCFVDVGANIGLYTMRYSKFFNATLAVEANPATYYALRANIELGRYANVQVINVAASNAKGRAQINVAKSGMLGWSRLGEDASWETYPVDVELNTLDELTGSIRDSSRVALLKIDVEGHEREVLEGAEQTLKRDGPVVLFEALPGRSGASVTQLLTDAGYSHFFTFERKLGAEAFLNRTSIRPIKVSPENVAPHTLIFSFRP